MTMTAERLSLEQVARELETLAAQGCRFDLEHDGRPRISGHSGTGPSFAEVAAWRDQHAVEIAVCLQFDGYGQWTLQHLREAATARRLAMTEEPMGVDC